MTKQELREYIKSMLGCPLVKVELTDEQIDHNINTARAEMIKWGVGNATTEISFTMPLSAHQTEYDLPAGLTTVTDIKDFSSGRLGSINTLFSTGNILYNMGFMNFLRGAGTFNMASYHMALQYMDMIDKYSQSNYVFRYYNFNNTLRVQPPPPSGEYITLEDGTEIESPGFIYINGYIISEEGLNTNQVGVYDEWLWDKTWIQNYAVALCKITLGRIRSKFSGQTSISNVGIELDGDTLLSEGREDKEKLEESLRSEESWETAGDIILG